MRRISIDELQSDHGSEDQQADERHSDAHAKVVRRMPSSARQGGDARNRSSSAQPASPPSPSHQPNSPPSSGGKASASDRQSCHAFHVPPAALKLILRAGSKSGSSLAKAHWQGLKAFLRVGRLVGTSVGVKYVAMITGSASPSANSTWMRTSMPFAAVERFHNVRKHHEAAVSTGDTPTALS